MKLKNLERADKSDSAEFAMQVELHKILFGRILNELEDELPDYSFRIKGRIRVEINLRIRHNTV